MRRVYDAAIKAKLIGQVNQLTDLATKIDETPQTVKNWDARGPSAQGLLKIQKTTGINAVWAETGEGPMYVSLPNGGAKFQFGGPDGFKSAAQKVNELTAEVKATDAIEKARGGTTDRQALLARALEILGAELAQEMPADVRDDAAELLGKLAKRNGAARHQAELVALLQASGGNRAKAA